MDFKNWANPGLFLFIFCSFLVTISIIQIEKSVDGVLGIQTWGCKMVGADKTTELWRWILINSTNLQIINITSCVSFPSCSRPLLKVFESTRAELFCPHRGVNSRHTAHLRSKPSVIPFSYPGTSCLNTLLIKLQGRGIRLTKLNN